MSTLADARRERVMTAALTVAQRDGWANMTREAVAAEAGVAAGTVNNAVAAEGGTMASLRDAVMSEAVRLGVLPIVAEGLVARHAAALGAPVEVRQAAMTALAG